MAVDRGGLQYRIEVVDKFSATTSLFRQEMRLSKEAFRSFQKDLQVQRGAAKTLRETAQAAREVGRARQEESRATQRSTRNLTEAERLERRRVSTLRSLRQSLALLRDTDVQAARAAVSKERATQRTTQVESQRDRTLRRLRQQLVLLKDAEIQAAKAAIAQEKANQKAAKAETDRERQERKFLAAKRRILDARVLEARLIDEGLKAQKREDRVLSGSERTLRAIREAKARILRQRQIEQALIDAGLRKAKQERRALTEQEEAQLRVARAIRARAVAQAQLAILRAQGQGELITPALLRRAGELERTTKRTAQHANSFFFTFRRLIGILAVFTLARRAVQTFQDLIRLGLGFSDAIRTAQTSIAGILLATTELTDETGRAVEGAEALARAEELAGAQIRLLRQDALRTTATFRELLDTFQIAVAPGIAAGLNLDEIRRLSVSISQAATAIGLPQNQLAEEIRSLLTGTIQARTTRIATALGITNADIRRLRETGELFDFLEERFRGFAEAAEKQARSTLSGITALVRGALEEVLGRAAEPLRQELLSTLQDIFDEILLIRDEAGNVSPRPEAVEAFRGFFESLQIGVQRARELSQELGFEGFRELGRTIGTGLVAAIEGVVGFARVLLEVFRTVASVVRGISDLFGITRTELGKVFGVLGTILSITFVWRNTIGIIIKQVVALHAAFVATTAESSRLATVLKALPGILARTLVLATRLAIRLALVVFAVNGIVRAFTGLDVTIGDTVKIIELSFKNAFGTIIRFGEIQFKQFANAIVGIFVSPISFLSQQFGRLLSILGGVAAFAESLGAISEGQRQTLEDAITNLEILARERGKKGQFVVFSEENINEDKRRLREFLEESRQEFTKLRADIASRGVLGEGFDAEFARLAAAAKKAGKDGEGFVTVINTARRAVQALAEDMVELDDELLKIQTEFQALQSFPGLEGIGADIEGIFDETEVSNAEKLRQITREIATTQRALAELRAKEASGVELTKEERATILSLEQAEQTLLAGITNFQELSLQLARSRAAVVATKELPALERELEVLRLRAAIETQTAAALEARVDRRQVDILQAQQALELARQEASQARETREKEIAAIRARAAGATGEEAEKLEALASTLERRNDLENDIADAKERQLAVTLQEAELVATGTLGEGIRRGFRDVAEDLPTQFEAGVEIVKQSVQALASFISQSIIDAFDPTKDGTLLERFSDFLAQISKLILDTLIQLAIRGAILRAIGGFNAGGEVGGEGFHKGGFARAKGYRRGRRIRRPAGLHPADRVPAWLEDGEFVVRRKVVERPGVLDHLEALNNGNFPVTPSLSAATAAPAQGMQTGGIVADRLDQAATRGDQDEGFVVAPVLVASERSMDIQTAQGKKSFRRFFQQNTFESPREMRRRR